MYKATDAEIITIGDELLIGQVIDTNSAWMAQQLNLQGINVRQISSVPDSANEILLAIKEAEQRAGIILITGGLGPTKDDITKTTLNAYFGGKMVLNLEQLRKIEEIFAGYGKEVSELNRKQAEVPDTCICLVNPKGTAPGMWFEQNQHIYVSMPGVPYEMKTLMQGQVLPMLQQKIKSPPVLHRTFLTQGIGESDLAEKIETWETALPKNMKLAYLPSPGEVRLRLTIRGMEPEMAQSALEEQAQKLYAIIPKVIYGEGNTQLPEIVHQTMLQKGITLSLAESCTGGRIAHLLTLLPGCSAYFKGGAVVYSNELKVSVLGVNEETIKRFGAVSRETAEEMAYGAKTNFGSDFALAVTGIAGPDGGSVEKPVGTVWVAIAADGKVISRMLRLGTNRNRNITVATLAALHLLLKTLKEA